MPHLTIHPHRIRRPARPPLHLTLALTLALILALSLVPGPLAAAGQAAPPASFPDLPLALSAKNAKALGLDHGGPSSLSRIPARALLVLLVSYFCPPCHKEVPRIKELAQRLRERGLAGSIRLVGLAAGDDEALVESFKSRHGGLPFALLPDPDLAAHQRLGTPMVPSLFVVAKSGGALRLLRAQQGEFVEDPDAYLDEVLRLLPAAAKAEAPRREK